MRSWLLIIAITLFASPVLANKSDTILVLTSDFVPANKFKQLDKLAADYQLRVEVAVAGVDDPVSQQTIDNAQLMILDGPRPSDRAAAESLLPNGTAKISVPWIQIGGGRPMFGHLAPPVARQLMGYYQHGTERNYRYMLAGVKSLLAGLPLTSLPPAITLSDTGVYSPSGLYPNLSTYLSDTDNDSLPLAGFVISDSLISNMQTSMLDALYLEAETFGIKPVIFWFNQSQSDGLTQFWHGSQPVAVVNMTHMQNGEARKAEFATLNIPILQAFTYRNGSVQDWRNDVNGLAAATAATLMAVPEAWGMTDPLVIAAMEEGEAQLIPEQTSLLLGKIRALSRLQTQVNQQKQLALLFWNTPSGEENFSASNLNVPASIASVIAELARNDYRVPYKTEAEIIAKGKQLIGGLYHPERLVELYQQGAAISLSVADYQQWFQRLPETIRQEVNEKWGKVNEHWALREINNQKVFIFPAQQWQNLLLMPQPPRSGKVGADTHDTKVPPDHYYLAAYLALQQRLLSAVIHFGTHGTQEWTPGKAKGLSANDYPFLTLGDLPVIYPYIQDNVTEALQARRRGRATTVSHQTPAFAPSGLYKELLDIHGLIHEYELLSEGQVKQEVVNKLIAQSEAMSLDKELGFIRADIDQDFAHFYDALHDHLHALAASVTPLGLHTFGVSALQEHRLLTVLQQLGPDFYEAAGENPKEYLAADLETIKTSNAMLLLRNAVLNEFNAPDNESLNEWLDTARYNYAHLTANNEMSALLNALDGGFVPGGLGGDPVRMPETTSGTNLYGFDPLKIPSPSAYKASEKALQQVIDNYIDAHDRAPKKLAFSMWSSESQRHMGVVEGQVLHALGLRPVWGRNGRLERLEIIPQGELDRERIDVVLQLTSLYRDQFDGFMNLLAEAIADIAELSDGNPIATNSKALTNALIAKGIDAEQAEELAKIRLFGNEPGDYGTGVPDLALDSTRWDDDSALADQYLSRLQYAFGRKNWGTRLPGNSNLFGEQLKGVDAAVMSRSSNLHGMLSTDHPFEFLGGMASAVRKINGQSPELYINDLRSSVSRTVTTATFISEEMRARYLNPSWITNMQTEGYAGALNMLDTVNNVFGWQAMAPEVIRDDQWEALSEVFVEDKYELGLNEWFDEQHPVAQMQLIERMVEAIRKDYWQASDKAKAALAQRYDELQQANPQHAAPEKTEQFLQEMMAGFGLGTQPRGAGQMVSGQTLKKVESPPSATSLPVLQLLMIAGILLLLAVGIIAQKRKNKLFSQS